MWSLIRKRKIFAKYSLYRYLDVNSFFYFSHPFIRIAWFQYRDRYRNISLLRVIIINFARFRTERKQHRARRNPSRDLFEEEGKCVSAYVCEREREKKKIKKEKKKKKRQPRFPRRVSFVLLLLRARCIDVQTAQRANLGEKIRESWEREEDGSGRGRRGGGRAEEAEHVARDG